MNTRVKIFIGIILVAIVVFAALAFDVPYDDPGKNGDPLSDLIRISEPQPDDTITSPGMFSGEARGTWFFEATFPIDVRASDDTVLGRGFAEAQDEWMTENFVPWKAIVSFDAAGYSEGYVRFMKDNPSGLPENDAFIDVPVKFTTTGTTTSPATTTNSGNTGNTGGTGTAKACKPTGCSGQICSDEDVVTTCEFRPEYACYQNARCERLADGECGWVETSSLVACLAYPPQE